MFICHGTTQKHLRVRAIFSKVLGLIFVLYVYKYVKANQIRFSYFPFSLSIAPLMKPIILKCIGHRSRYKGIGKHKLRPVHGLSVNTPGNFFSTEHQFLWKGYSSSTYILRCLLFKRHIKSKNK